MNHGPISPLSNEDFKQRRSELLSRCLPNSLCIIPAASLVKRSNDTEYAFRQDSDFWYLTGFNEPEAVLLLSNSDDYNGQMSMVFVQPTDAFAEVWHGRRLGVHNAANTLGVDYAHSVEELDEHLTDIVDGHHQLYFASKANPRADDFIEFAIESCRVAPKQSKAAPHAICDIRPMLHSMRLIKCEKEIEILKRAAEISAEAHIRAMKYAYAGCNEFELEAEIKHEFAIKGAKHEAYHSIVGGGENACILHYTENNQAIADGELVLIDAGCELHGYAADITRTFPVNGQFTEVQKALYQLVLDSQYAALEVLKPGNTIAQGMSAAVRVITEGLIELGILQGDLDENLEDETWKAFFMHGLGHWLGLDVHDVGIYKSKGKDCPLAPGMVMTVEPGLYIPSSAKVAPQFKGIGIRIEDDIVITESGHKVLTSKVPKRIEDIEALMS
jgi:Xaa-Pro aminopeptidase